MVFHKKLTILLWFLRGSLLTKGDTVTLNDDAPCLKGRNHTLTCEFQERGSIIEWKIEHNDTPIVHCYVNSCHLNPAFNGQYCHSGDPAKNIFNLTILDVNESFNGNKYVCSDGTNSVCKVLKVEDTKPVVHEDTENEIITATSACSFQDMNVTFKLMKIDSNKQEIEFRPKILNKTVTNCSNECGNKQQIRHTETFSARPNGNITKNYKVEVDYGNGLFSSFISTIQIIIEEEEFEDRVSEPPTMTSLLVIPIVPATVVVTAILIVKYRRLLNKLFSYLRTDDSRNDKELPLSGTGDFEVKKVEEGEKRNPIINGDIMDNVSDNGTPSSGNEQLAKSLPSPDIYFSKKYTKGKDHVISFKGQIPKTKQEMNQTVDEDIDKRSENDTHSFIPVYDQCTEPSHMFHNIQDNHLPMKRTKGKENVKSFDAKIAEEGKPMIQTDDRDIDKKSENGTPSSIQRNDNLTEDFEFVNVLFRIKE